MTVSEYISALTKVKISDADGHDLKKKYGRDIPKIILQIASYDEKAVFLDTGTRMLSYKEILNFKKDMKLDDSISNLIPIADKGENDFVVYDMKSKKWMIFNVNDSTVFRKAGTFVTLL